MEQGEIDEGTVAYQVVTYKRGRNGWMTRYAIFPTRAKARKNMVAVASLLPTHYEAGVEEVKWMKIGVYGFWSQHRMLQPIDVVRGELQSYGEREEVEE